MTKITYTVALSTAIATLSAIEGFDPEVIAKLDALRVQTEKRNATENRKPTKAQALTASLADVVKEVLAASDKPLTIAEILTADERFAGVSNQKMAAVLRSMADSVTKVPDKRVNRFTLA